MTLSFAIPGAPRTKKNHGRIVWCGRSPKLLPSKEFEAWNKDAQVARERVVWFHTIWASQAYGLKTERTWLVRVGDSCYVRCLQYFRVDSRPGPVRFFKRGPAIKYNKWLSQPQGFAFDAQQETEAPVA